MSVKLSKYNLHQRLIMIDRNGNDQYAFVKGIIYLKQNPVYRLRLEDGTIEWLLESDIEVLN